MKVSVFISVASQDNADKAIKSLSNRGLKLEPRYEKIIWQGKNADTCFMAFVMELGDVPEIGSRINQTRDHIHGLLSADMIDYQSLLVVDGVVDCGWYLLDNRHPRVKKNVPYLKLVRNSN